MIEPTNQTPAYDPFSPENLRLPQSFTEMVGAKKLLTTVPCRKPGNQTFFRTHPSPDFRVSAALLALKEDREDFFVPADFAPEISEEIVLATLHAVISRQGELSIWAIRLPGPDGKDSDWWKSARDAAEMATRKWIRIKANQSQGAYDIWTAEGNIPEPEWPADKSFTDLLRICFKDKIVNSHDHPALKRLRGM